MAEPAFRRILLKLSGEALVGGEGFDDEEIGVAWIDRDGNAQQEVFDGLWATCVQHEIDHLDGKLFIDYLKPLKRQLITRKMQKLKRERARA